MTWTSLIPFLAGVVAAAGYATLLLLVWRFHTLWRNKSIEYDKVLIQAIEAQANTQLNANFHTFVMEELSAFKAKPLMAVVTDQQLMALSQLILAALKDKKQLN